MPGWKFLAVIVLLVVAIGLPAAGQWLSGNASRRIERVVATRDVANNVELQLTDFSIDVRAYDTSGESPALVSREFGERAEISAGDLAHTLEQARAHEDVQPEMQEPLEALITSAERYLAFGQQRIDAISANGTAGPLEQAAVAARGDSAGASSEFRAVAIEMSDEAVAASTSARRWSLGLSLAAVTFVAACLGGYGWREVLRQRARAAEAEQVAEARLQMVNMASHELRNPLAVVSLSAQMLIFEADRMGEDSFAEVAKTAHAAATRADALVSELLDLGRIDAGRLHLQLQPVPVAKSIEAAIEATLLHRGQREVEVIGATPGLRVLADRARFFIILRNLVDNAVKFSPEGSKVRIEVRSSGGEVTIDVIDQGPGLPEARLEQSFERFNRSPQAAHPDGVGIGLFLSRELAQRMNGDVCVIPGSSHGWFRLSLVLAQSEAMAAGKSSAADMATQRRDAVA